jgi:L-ascorbate metabolism protein UlaG (beta-lactamase superfamily)
MQISYFGHSCFKLKGKHGTLVTDPYSAEGVYGISMPQLTADLVTVSHHHRGHDAVEKIKASANRKKPFIIDFPGEYEVGGISVFGVKTFHDKVGGKERGNNLIFTILIDGITVVIWVIWTTHYQMSN